MKVRTPRPKKPRPGLHPKPPKTTTRVPYGDALALAGALANALRDATVTQVLLLTQESEEAAAGSRSSPPAYVFAGSLRRHAPTVKDLDLLLVDVDTLSWGLLPLVRGLALHAFGPAKATGMFTWHGKRIPVDVRRVPPESLGAALEYFTGPKGHNLGMRMKAKKKGLRLNEYGLFDAKGKKLAGDTEVSIYEKLGHPWRPPEQRGS